MHLRLGLCAVLLLAACHHGTSTSDAGPTDAGPFDAGPADSGPPPPAFRCDLDLSPFLTSTATGAFARPISDASDLLTGDAAQGKIGDYLIGNDKVHIIVQGPDRHLGPQPFGGNIIDAALVGDDMHDEFGEVGLFYNFGRTVDAQHFEVLRDGSEGGPAVIAASGQDALNDWVAVKTQLQQKLGAPPLVDPEQALPLRITNYFVLAPGEKRVKEITAFCNDGAQPVGLEAGDLTDPGGNVEFFNPDACVHGFGYSNTFCFGLDGLSWYGYLGTGVAYGYAPYHPGSATRPEENSVSLTVAGVTGSVLGATGIPGLLSWFNPDAGVRQGELDVPANGQAVMARDFVVGRDLGDVATTIETTRAALLNRTVVPLSGTVTDTLGSPVAGARVAVERAGSAIGVETIFTTDANGQYQGALYPGSYNVSAWAPGRPIASPQPVALSGSPVTQDFTLSLTRSLSVTVQDDASNPLPAKVTLLCVESGGCPTSNSQLGLYTDITRDPLPNDVALQGFVPPSGTATFQVPPGEYDALVSRGPAYSIYPPTWPGSGQFLDMRVADKSLAATLVRVVDTTGWLASDFHVHAINSPDSYVPNVDRVESYLAEGMEVLVSTDHEFVTDLAPYNQALGGQSLLATVIGEECSPMNFGHYILYPYPIVRSDLNGGALDWAGGSGPTFTLGQMFSAARNAGIGTIQFNHPRGFLGGLSYLQVDMDTLATHAPAANFRMDPGTTPANDTGLMSSNFDSFELLNPGIDGFDGNSDAAHANFNDWFTLLSEGLKATGTGVSDTHMQFATAAGYWRTWVQTGVDSPANLQPAQLSSAVNTMKATVSDGPFIVFTGHRLDASGNPASADVGPGEVIPPGAGDVELTIDVQVPEYMDLSRIELYTHSPGDDATCPLDPAGPNAATERVACNGVSNTHWPSSSILASRDVVLGPNDLETVGTVDGQAVHRYHHLETFQIPAPAGDTWIVPFVYGTTDLFPLVYAKVDSTGQRVPAIPFALANPIFIDADGNGYDHPPFTPPSSASAPLPVAKPPPPDQQRGLREFMEIMTAK